MILSEHWETQNVTLAGVRPGDFVTIGGDNFIGGGTGGIMEETGYPVRATYPAPQGAWDGANLQAGLGPMTSSLTASHLPDAFFVCGIVESDDEVTWGVYNGTGGSVAPHPANTGTIIVQSAWEMQTSTQFFLSTSDSPTEEVRPGLLRNGFRVTRTPEGIAGSGETLNTVGRNYNYWAFS